MGVIKRPDVEPIGVAAIGRHQPDSDAAGRRRFGEQLAAAELDSGADLPGSSV